MNETPSAVSHLIVVGPADRSHKTVAAVFP